MSLVALCGGAGQHRGAPRGTRRRGQHAVLPAHPTRMSSEDDDDAGFASAEEETQ
eukprot:COSAG02_NODE_54684_length_294_cov_6.338462_1_plen_54_part_01